MPPTRHPPARHPIIGVLGGMGPAATVDLMRRVIAATPARDDADHIHLIVDSNPKVPSRIQALIEGAGESPAPELVRMARRLEGAGATVLAIACNTAHAYADDIRAAVSVPLLDMIMLTAARISSAVPTARRVGVLASTAVLQLGLYERALAAMRIALLPPRRQDELMAVIKMVKRGETGPKVVDGFVSIATELATHCDMLLVACTELSILADRITPPISVVDSLDVLVAAIVDKAGIVPAHSELQDG